MNQAIADLQIRRSVFFFKKIACDDRFLRLFLSIHTKSPLSTLGDYP